MQGIRSPHTPQGWTQMGAAIVENSGASSVCYAYRMAQQIPLLLRCSGEAKTFVHTGTAHGCSGPRYPEQAKNREWWKCPSADRMETHSIFHPDNGIIFGSKKYWYRFSIPNPKIHNPKFSKICFLSANIMLKGNAPWNISDSRFSDFRCSIGMMQIF